ncbi:MAG TPA: CbiX/SirB N-terminal domain-containing protein [Bryobacteraceae bacterium]|nr:CbiX/SirB N-terminal domain-containing protein [Bryobacteraceae bacterium]
MSTGIIIFAHGSPVESANDAVREVAREAARAGPFDVADVAFLDPYRPALKETVARMEVAGVSRILVVPYFLTMGLHLQRDLPRIVEDAARVHPGLDIRVTPPLDGHPALSEIVLDRARAALGEWP